MGSFCVNAALCMAVLSTSIYLSIILFTVAMHTCCIICILYITIILKLTSFLCLLWYQHVISTALMPVYFFVQEINQLLKQHAINIYDANTFW